jgi:hypothetical protein
MRKKKAGAARAGLQSSLHLRKTVVLAGDLLLLRKTVVLAGDLLLS